MTAKDIEGMIRAIKKHCLFCSGENRKNVINCPIKTCSLYPYRNGESHIAREKRVSEEQITWDELLGAITNQANSET